MDVYFEEAFFTVILIIISHFQSQVLQNYFEILLCQAEYLAYSSFSILIFYESMFLAFNRPLLG